MLDRLRQFPKIAAVVGDAARVGVDAVLAGRVAVGAAVLGDLDDRLLVIR
jgi:hypothetical protein